MGIFKRAYTRVIDRLDELRESYWFVPSLMVALAPLFVFLLQELDQVAYPLIEQYAPFLYRVNETGIRAVLGVIAGSMITVTGIVFSITMVALTLASSQYGPRLLRTFLRDRGNQVVLGTFTMTFVYSLLVLWMVGAWQYTQLSTLFAVVLAVVSLLVLIYYIHHTAHSIQASSIISSLFREMQEQLSLLCERSQEENDKNEYCDHFDKDDYPYSMVLASKQQGYIRLMTQESIWQLACASHVAIEIHAMPGQFVVKGAPLVSIYSKDALEDCNFDVLHECFIYGNTRTGVQDVEYIVEQLVEIAVRSMSPGINDPMTAIACIHRLSAGLSIAAPNEFTSSWLCDQEGNVRLIKNSISFSRLVAQCFDSIRNYARQDPRVVEVMLTNLAQVASFCQADDRLEVLKKHGDEIVAAFATVEHHTPRDVKRVEKRHESLLERIEERLAQISSKDP